MEKKQKQIIIVAVLILVLVIAWVNAFSAIKKRAAKKTAVSQTAVVVPATESTQQVSVAQPIYPKETNLEWLRCPFSGKFYTGYKGEAFDLKLAGILWDEEKPQAIINNEVVGVGSNVGVYNVVEIRQYSVFITDGSDVFELKLEDFAK